MEAHGRPVGCRLDPIWLLPISPICLDPNNGSWIEEPWNCPDRGRDDPGCLQGPARAPRPRGPSGTPRSAGAHHDRQQSACAGGHLEPGRQSTRRRLVWNGLPNALRSGDHADVGHKSRGSFGIGLPCILDPAHHATVEPGIPDRLSRGVFFRGRIRQHLHGHLGRRGPEIDCSKGRPRRPRRSRIRPGRRSLSQQEYRCRLARADSLPYQWLPRLNRDCSTACAPLSAEREARHQLRESASPPSIGERSWARPDCLTRAKCGLLSMGREGATGQRELSDWTIHRRSYLHIIGGCSGSSDRKRMKSVLQLTNMQFHRQSSIGVCVFRPVCCSTFLLQLFLPPSAAAVHWQSTHRHMDNSSPYDGEPASAPIASLS